MKQKAFVPGYFGKAFEKILGYDSSTHRDGTTTKYLYLFCLVPADRGNLFEPKQTKVCTVCSMYALQCCLAPAYRLLSTTQVLRHATQFSKDHSKSDQHIVKSFRSGRDRAVPSSQELNFIGWKLSWKENTLVSCTLHASNKYLYFTERGKIQTGRAGSSKLAKVPWGAMFGRSTRHGEYHSVWSVGSVTESVYFFRWREWKSNRIST